MLLVAKENPVREAPRKATENDTALETPRRARHSAGGVMGSAPEWLTLAPNVDPPQRSDTSDVGSKPEVPAHARNAADDPKPSSALRRPYSTG
jgi:hypothetical protein